MPKRKSDERKIKVWKESWVNKVDFEGIQMFKKNMYNSHRFYYQKTSRKLGKWIILVKKNSKYETCARNQSALM